MEWSGVEMEWKWGGVEWTGLEWGGVRLWSGWGCGMGLWSGVVEWGCEVGLWSVM